MRRYIWGVVLVLLVVALVSQTIAARRQANRYPSAYASTEFVRVQVTDGTAVKDVAPAAKAKVDQPSSKTKNGKTKKAPPEPVEPAYYWKATIESKPLPKAVAVEDFLDSIRAKLTHDLHLTNTPSREWVNDGRFIVKTKLEETQPLSKADELIGEVVRLRGEVELTPDGWRDLLRLERADKIHERMELMTRGLVFLTVLLGAVAGYIRMDEWTKGYYSGRLFLAAILLVGAAFGFAVYGI